MANISKYTDSDFAKANDDIRNGDKVTFLDEGTPDKGQYGERLIFDLKMPRGDNKKLTPNKTSLRALGEEWGEDTAAWVGKIADVSVTKQPVQGKLVDVIYLTPSMDIEDKDIPIVEPEKDGKTK